MIPAEWGYRYADCVDCGTRFRKQNGAHVRCRSCQVIYRRAYDRQRQRKNRERPVRA